MKKVYKICLLNAGLVLLLAALISYAFSGGLGLRDYIGISGIVSVLGGAIYILIGLLLLVFRRKVWGQGFLLSAGILLLFGFTLCSTVL